MILKIYSFCLCAFAFGSLQAQTVLNPGDMAFVAYSSSGTDFFSVITFVDLQPCTKIYFTDNPYRTATGLCTSGEEFCVSLTVTSRIPCGTVIRYNDGSPGTFTIPAGSGFITQEFIPTAGNNFGLSSGGDNVFVFQGSYAAPSFVCAIKSHPYNAAGTAACADREDTELPPTLTNGVNALDLSGCTYGKYNCSVTSGTIAAIRSAITNDANWTNCSTSFSAGTICTSFTPTCANCTSGPSSAASGITFTSVNCSTLTITWSRCNNMDVLAVLRDGAPISADPTDGVSLSPNSTFGVGAPLGGGFVVYSGTSNSVTVTGLMDGSIYHLALYTFYPNNGICYNPTEATASFTIPDCPLGIQIDQIWIEKGTPSMLSWNTVEESGLDWFEPEFSQDGGTFVPFSQLSAYNQPHQYSVQIPESYSSGFIRIKIHDKGGNTAFSDVLEYQSLSSGVIAYPNPVDEKLSIKAEDYPIQSLEIYNIFGQQVHFVGLKDEVSTLQVEFGNIISGTYMLVITTKDHVERRTIVVTH